MVSVVDIVDLDDGLVGVPDGNVVGGGGGNVVGGGGGGGAGTHWEAHRNVKGPPGPPGGQIPLQI